MGKRTSWAHAKAKGACGKTCRVISTMKLMQNSLIFTKMEVVLKNEHF